MKYECSEAERELKYKTTRYWHKIINIITISIITGLLTLYEIILYDSFKTKIHFISSYDFH